MVQFLGINLKINLTVSTSAGRIRCKIRFSSLGCAFGISYLFSSSLDFTLSHVFKVGLLFSGWVKGGAGWVEGGGVRAAYVTLCLYNSTQENQTLSYILLISLKSNISDAKGLKISWKWFLPFFHGIFDTNNCDNSIPNNVPKFCWRHLIKSWGIY